ncbi:uncharacterized protein C6orf183 [Urocitellus parryii]
MILKNYYLVAEPKPLVIQADVLQRELEICLRREYTPENLPLLLLQTSFPYAWKPMAQRIRLANAELCLPISLKQKRVGYIMQEYSDAVQRAERLSIARENFLMGKKNPPNLVMLEDVTIYTRWLVCHLHSFRTVHHYLQALQYLPISNMLSPADNQDPEAGQESDKVCVNDMDPNIQSPASSGLVDTSISGPMRTDADFMLPQHTTETGELKPQLRRLLSHFHIPYDLQELRNSAKEMELFSLVFQKFQSIFTEQQRMQMFPDYEAGTAKAENLSGPPIALKKRANWISFIKIKPKCDPWQKKMLTKLKERRRIDVLMQLQAKFLKLMFNSGAIIQFHASRIWGERSPVFLLGRHTLFWVEKPRFQEGYKPSSMSGFSFCFSAAPPPSHSNSFSGQSFT